MSHREDSRHLPDVSNVAYLEARRDGRPPGEAAPSDAALVVSARAGERWAREALFRRHARLANGLAFRLLGRDNEVDDVVQDAYVIVLSRLDKVEDPQAFASFLASVIVHRVRRVLRRRRLARRLGLVPAAEPIDPALFLAYSAPPDTLTELRSLYEVVDELPTDERLALLLRRVEGMPLQQVADACGCSVATAKRRIAAAEERLRKAETRRPSPSTTRRPG